MRIAFYAPLKSPNHAVPSGDRRIGRLIGRALELAGHDVVLASEYRSFCREASFDDQQKIAAEGEREAEAIASAWEGAVPQAWITYHLYYKAPDWIGPRLARKWGIPYLAVEASFAPKRAGGPWDFNHRQVERAIAAADALVCLNPNDRACLEPIATGQLFDLPPFLDAAPFQDSKLTRQSIAAKYGLDGLAPWLIAVGMMRSGHKHQSFVQLARALETIAIIPWQLLVVGDGPMRAEVEREFAAVAGRLVWLGVLDEPALSELYAAADLMTWPAEREALGMAMLEAQAAGLPVVAGRTDGVPAIIASNQTGILTTPGHTRQFGNAVRSLLQDRPRSKRLRSAAREKVLRRHSLETAACMLNSILSEVTCRK